MGSASRSRSPCCRSGWSRGGAAGPPPGYFTFQSIEGPQFLRTYPPDLESLPERLLKAGYSTRMVAGNPLYFLSGLARDGFEIAVKAGVSPGPRITRLARRLLLSSDPDVPLFLLVHYMDPHEWEEHYIELFGDPNFAHDCAQTFVEVSESNDIAWARGTCNVTFSLPDGSIGRGSSKWAKVWVRMEDGEWKCRLNTWNSDI